MYLFIYIHIRTQLIHNIQYIVYVYRLIRLKIFLDSYFFIVGESLWSFENLLVLTA